MLLSSMQIPLEHLELIVDVFKDFVTIEAKMRTLLADPVLRSNLQMYSNNLLLEEYLFREYSKGVFPGDWFALEMVVVKPTINKQQISSRQMIDIM